MVVKQLVTAEELWAMPETPGVRYELVRGELVAVPGAGFLHALIAKLLVRRLDVVATEGDLGLVVGDGATFVLQRHPDLLRIPDVAFVSWARLPDRRIPEGFAYFAPDLAVEIVSPNDRANDIRDKVHEYLEAGTRLVWVLWPRRKGVTVYEPDRDPRELGPDDLLDGGELLPGFSIRVAELFDVS